MNNSLPAIVLQRATTTPDRTALRKKALGRWREYTWREYAERAGAVGRGLLALGVEGGERVGIQSENRPAWLFADVGIQGIGAIAVGIDPTWRADEVGSVLAQSSSKVVIVEDEEQLDKVLAVRTRLADLRKIVIIDPSTLRGFTDPMLMTFAELELLGSRNHSETDNDVQVDEFASRVREVDPTWTAFIAYDSPPDTELRGSVVTHADVAGAAHMSSLVFRVREGDNVLSYLPLCGVAERMISLINAITVGYVVNFPESPSTVPQDLQEIQPTFFLGVPRLWEGLRADVESRMAGASRLKRRNYSFWLRRGLGVAARRRAGRSRPGLGYALGWLLLYRSLRKKLGLARVRETISAATQMAPGVVEYFWALGVTVREVDVNGYFPMATTT